MSDELPQGWAEVPLRDFTKVKWGNTSITKKSYVPSGFPAFSASGQDGFLKSHDWEGPAVVLSAIGARCGKCFPADGKWTAIKNTIVIQGNPAVINHKLLFYFLNDEKRWVISGTGQPFITMGTAQETMFPFAPLAEQRRIVAKLETLLGKVDACQQRLAKIPVLLKRFRQSVLAAACSGRLTADWREENPDAEPAATTVKRIPVPPKPSRANQATDEIIPGLAAVSVGNPETQAPEKWEWTPLIRVARLESGHTPSTKHSEYWDGGISWVGIQDARVSHGGTIRQTRHEVSQLGIENSAARVLPSGTVCLSRTASVGYVVILGKEMATSQDFVNWVCTEAVIPKWLMYAFLAEGEHILRFGRGSTHTTIYFPEVVAFHVCLPPVAEQHEIVRRVEALFALADQIEARFHAAQTQVAKLTPSLLARAFRGQLVPQDPTDEPAEKLLERIKAKKE